MADQQLVPMHESPGHLGSVIEIDHSIPARVEWGGCCDVRTNTGRLLVDLYADRDAIQPVAVAGDVVEVRVGTAGFSFLLAFVKGDERLFATDWKCMKNHLREPLVDKRKKAREAAGWGR